MDPVKAKILLNIATLSVSGIAIGLTIFWIIRRLAKKNQRASCSNLSAGQFDLLDLLLTGTIIIFFYSNIVVQFQTAMNPVKELSPEVNLSFIDVLVNMILILIVGAFVFSFASFLRGRNPKHIFGLSRLSLGWILAWGVSVIIPVYLAVSGASLLTQWVLSLDNNQQEPQEIVKSMMSNNDLSLRILLAFSAIIIAPLVEEIIFRGYIYTVIKRYSHHIFAAFITSLLFAVIHGHVEGLIPLFSLAVILTLAYEMTGCIWVPILVHSLFNGINTTFILIFFNG